MAEGARCKQVEEVLDEIEAVRHAMSRANKGDLVVICVDKHAEVMTELENWAPQAQAGAGVTSDAPAADPDYEAAAPRRRPERQPARGGLGPSPAASPGVSGVPPCSASQS